ncbi:hypothetical protein TNCV_3016121 [Trichonephila clavipes]|nr:hypothetical protein TNCV_3016121 [Trichonephila clavipes]
MIINVRYYMKDVTLKFIKRMGIIPEGDIFLISPKKRSPELTSPTDFLVKRSPHVPLSLSLRTLYPIASCLQLILCRTKSAIIDAFGAVSLGSFC